MADSFRIYTYTQNNSSWTRVGMGLAQGLEQAGRKVSVFSLEDVLEGDSAVVRQGHDADIGVFVGPPDQASMMAMHGSHRERWPMIAANSTWLPKDVFRSLEGAEAVTGYLAPSRWGREIVSSYTDLPVRLWHHGIDPACFCPAYDPPIPQQSFEVLHMASTHFQRKSTAALIRAWAIALRAGEVPAESMLRLVVDGPPGYYDQTIDAIFLGAAGIGENDTRRDTIDVLGRLNLSPNQAARYYQRHHFVCQPSRAEGFGLVPLEARACGVPAIMTHCTGHRDHFFAGRAVPVASGDDVPSDDGPDAKAPMVRDHHIRDALGMAAAAREQLSESAEAEVSRVAERWSWKAVTEAFLKGLE